MISCVDVPVEGRRTLQGPWWLLASVLLGLALAPPVRSATAGFTDVTDQAGLVFTHSNLPDTPGGNMLGGGTAGDFNGDGWPDLFAVDGGSAPDHLFINHGGVFVDEAAAWGLTQVHRGGGAAAGDYDGDGDIDLMVTSFGNLPGAAVPGQHKLYRNDGGHFTDVAAAAGVAFSNPAIPDGYSPVWGDYDLDGDLDLWIGGWWEGPGELEWNGTRLFRNEGDGTFTDVSVASGVFDNHVRGFSAAFVDMDGDRYPELLVAGDFGTSRYFSNHRDGSFTRHLFTAAEAVMNGMGTAVADFDRDGLQDWFITSIFPAYHFFGPPGNRMWLNKGTLPLEMLPESCGLFDGGWGWGATALDFDQDGWVDLFHTGGWQGPDIITGEWFLDEPSYLFRNDGNGRTFTEMGVAIGLDHRGQGRSAGVMDYDQDGDLDVFVLASGEPARLFRNDLAGEDAHWLRIRLTRGDNPRITPNGRGTQVRIRTSDGVTQVAQLAGNANYLGGNELALHFGLGAATTLDEVRVNWSDGFVTVLRDVAADQLLEIAASRPYSHGPLVRGAQADLTVAGLLPGERALFYGGIRGEGAGPCPPWMGGHLCMDVVSPVPLGSAVADTNGVAVLTIPVPDPQAGSQMTSQVVVLRGPDGSRSAKSNAITAPLLSAPAER